MRTILKTMLATGLFAWALSANAVPVTFDLASAPTSSVKINYTCLGCGVSATLNPLLGSLNQTLNAGDSWTFDFFDLNFSGFIGAGFGTIEATLGFDSPLGAPVAGGTGDGAFFHFLGVVTGGFLTWEQPGSFALADGTVYSVQFENLLGIAGRSTTVSGVITLLQGPGAVSVPEPSTLGLLGLGLIGLGIGVRRRTRRG